MADAIQQTEKPRVGAGGLVTVAYLKARLDAGEDHLGIFMPLILDVLPDLPNKYFGTSEVQEAVATRFRVAMPLETVGTLLKRAARKRVIVRDAGRFHSNPDTHVQRRNVSGEMAQVEAGQLRLADALRKHAGQRGLPLANSQQALDLVLRFLDQQQVALILGVPPEGETANLSPLESAVVAEFLHAIVSNDPALTAVLKGILEGLVLYHAAFLPDLPEVSRSFSNLTVAFDTVLVIQSLGYEGTGARALMRETIDLLKRSGIRCVIFDKTVQEIQRILRMFETKLATSQGRRELRPGAMARHFLTQRYSPSDVQEMSALLEEDISAVGFTIQRAPAHVAAFTHAETDLAKRLADRRTRDITEPRVQHDVDCVAGVLTLRAGHRSLRIEDARAVFATASGLVLKNTGIWWTEDEHEDGVQPIVHIRALANLAWLKKPATSTDLQIRELVVLCAAAMRPTQRMWQRFLRHLDDLQKSQRLSPEQATVIIVSAVSDRLLHDAEMYDGDPDDVDSGTLDEIVDRVVSQYREEATGAIAEAKATAEAQIRQAQAAAHEEAAKRVAEAEATAEARATQAEHATRSVAERLRRKAMIAEGRARRWASFIASVAYWVLTIAVLVASAAIAQTYFHGSGWLGPVVACAIVVLTCLETAGVLGHVRSIRLRLEGGLHQWLRRRLGADDLDAMLRTTELTQGACQGRDAILGAPTHSRLTVRYPMDIVRS